MCVFFLPFLVTIAARRVLSRVRVLYFPLSIVYSYFRFTISPGCDKFDFLRLTVQEIVDEYLRVHVRGGNTGPDFQHQCP